jgi:hypothetical protein
MFNYARWEKLANDKRFSLCLLLIFYKYLNIHFEWSKHIFVPSQNKCLIVDSGIFQLIQSPGLVFSKLLKNVLRSFSKLEGIIPTFWVTHLQASYRYFKNDLKFFLRELANASPDPGNPSILLWLVLATSAHPSNGKEQR